MKILIIRNYSNYIDVRSNTYNIQEIGLAKALINNGHICDIVFRTNDLERVEQYFFGQEKSITIYYKRAINVLKNLIYLNLDETILQYDIIQPCEYNQFQAWLLARKFPEKTVIYHGPYYSSFNRRYNLLCKVFDVLFLNQYKKLNTKFIVKSSLAKQFLNSKGITNVCVCGVGIDLSVFTLQDKDDVPEEINRIDNIQADIKLLYIGRLEIRRNILFLFDIIKKITQLGKTVVLIIVGDGDKNYTQKCIEYSEKLGIKNNIYWIKKLEQKYLSYVYEKAEIFLLPTYYEIFGMVLLEAMFFKKICITTSNGGSDMLITNNENGIIIDKFDVEKWVKRIISVLNNELIGEKALNTIKENYTWDKLAGSFIKVYQEKLVNKNENINNK